MQIHNEAYLDIILARLPAELHTPVLALRFQHREKCTYEDDGEKNHEGNAQREVVQQCRGARVIPGAHIEALGGQVKKRSVKISDLRRQNNLNNTLPDKT